MPILRSYLLTFGSGEDFLRFSTYKVSDFIKRKTSLERHKMYFYSETTRVKRIDVIRRKLSDQKRLTKWILNGTTLKTPIYIALFKLHSDHGGFREEEV